MTSPLAYRTMVKKVYCEGPWFESDINEVKSHFLRYISIFQKWKYSWADIHKTSLGPVFMN
jgi:hypothetical protein